MMVNLLIMMVLVMGPFLLGAARYVVVRTGRPAWLRRILIGRAKRTGVGVGAIATDELHAFLNANKRVELEHRTEEQVLRDDTLDGAPPRMGLDLDAGTAIIRSRKPPRMGN